MVTKVIVNNRFFDMPAKEASKILGVNYSTLMNRVRSNMPKWKNWEVSELSVEIKINNVHYEDIDKAIFALLDFKHRINKEKQKHKDDQN